MEKMSSTTKHTQQDILVNALIAGGRIKSKEVEKAMRSVDRKDFVPIKRQLYAYADSPQPIGYNATISAPHMHAIALVQVINFLGVLKTWIKEWS